MDSKTLCCNYLGFAIIPIGIIVIDDKRMSTVTRTRVVSRPKTDAWSTMAVAPRKRLSTSSTHSKTLRWVLIVVTILIIIALVAAAAVLYVMDKWPFEHVQPSNPEYKYPNGTYSLKNNVQLSAEAKDNINKNITALKNAQDKAATR